MNSVALAVCTIAVVKNNTVAIIFIKASMPYIILHKARYVKSICRYMFLLYTKAVVTIITLSKDERLLEMPAFSRGVFFFRFLGDTTYTDDEAVEWYWNGVSAVTEAAPLISGVRAGTTQLIEVTSLADCLDNDGTFFYASPVLYVHYPHSAHDYSKSLSRKAIQQAGIFLADRTERESKGYYGNTLYQPAALSFTGFAFKADPLKLGLVAGSRSSVSILNSAGSYDEISTATALGAAAEVLHVPSGETELSNAQLIYKGFTTGADRSAGNIDFDIVEQRFFYDEPVCPNVFTHAEYSAPTNGTGANPGTYGLDDKYIDKPKPVAFGDIRRGICVPLDSKKGADGDTYPGDASPGFQDITFLVADEAFGAVRAITALYDDNGNEVPIQSTDLPNNTVTFRWSWTDPDEKPKFDFSRFRWEGEGYDIDGTYNNGVDIIKWAFVNIAGLLFVEGVFDLDGWNVATASNTEPVGLSLQTTRGLTRELIEPITVSLQGVVLSLGDGRITFIDRDTDAVSRYSFGFEDYTREPSVEYDSKNVVSALTVNYSPDFVDDDFTLSVEDTNSRETVIQTFGLDRREPLSPLKTVLSDRADALAIAEEIMETSADVESPVTIEVPYRTGFVLYPFDMVTLDAGRYDEAKLKRCEVLEVKPDYNNYRVSITARIIEDIEEKITVSKNYGGGTYGASTYV
jgi:hypothetical protein